MFEWRLSNYVECKRCGFRYVTPTFSKEQFTVYYGQSYLDGYRDPDGRPRFLLREGEKKIQEARSILSFLERHHPAGGRVLDIGCGPGFILSAFKAHWEKVGIEVSRESAEYARKTFAIDVIEQQVHPGLFPTASFDAIIMFFVLEHLEEPRVVLESVSKWLRPDGHIALCIPNYGSAAARLFREYYRMYDDRGHIALWTIPILRRCLSELRMQIVRIERPYFRTPYFNARELMHFANRGTRVLLGRWLRGVIQPREARRSDLVSPPFYGNVAIVYAAAKPMADASSGG